jgi:hypothetical protein
LKGKKIKLIITGIILFFSFCISSVQASGDSGEFLKTWYIHLFQVAQGDRTTNAERYNQQELANFDKAKEQQIVGNQSQLNDMAKEVGSNVINNINRITADYVNQIEESKNTIISQEVTGDLQPYVEQKKKQIDQEITQLISKVIEEQK